MSTPLGAPLSLHARYLDGEPFDLAAHEGANVFVYFMRALTCPQCNTAVRTLEANRQLLTSKNVRVVIAVPDSVEAAQQWRARRAVTFPVIVGQDGTVHAQAGLLTKVFGMIQQSGGVLLDPAGAVRYVHVATNPGHSLDLPELLAALD